MVLCDVAYSDFIFLEEKKLSESEITKIQNSSMTLHDSSKDSNPRNIVYEYTIFEKKKIQSQDKEITSLVYTGVLEDLLPTNTVIMYANKFTEK